MSCVDRLHDQSETRSPRGRSLGLRLDLDAEVGPDERSTFCARDECIRAPRTRAHARPHFLLLPIAASPVINLRDSPLSSPQKTLQVIRPWNVVSARP